MGCIFYFFFFFLAYLPLLEYKFHEDRDYWFLFIAVALSIQNNAYHMVVTYYTFWNKFIHLYKQGLETETYGAYLGNSG